METDTASNNGNDTTSNNGNDTTSNNGNDTTSNNGNDSPVLILNISYAVTPHFLILIKRK
jgi:hypothetical protein